jgi:hypothetical protein
MFNTIVWKDFAQLRSAGVTPGKLLDPHSAAQIPPAMVAQAQGVIARGLTWAFLAMLVIAAVQLVVAFMMPPKSADHVPKGSEGIEALGA